MCDSKAVVDCDDSLRNLLAGDILDPAHGRLDASLAAQSIVASELVHNPLEVLLKALGELVQLKWQKSLAGDSESISNVSSTRGQLANSSANALRDVMCKLSVGLVLHWERYAAMASTSNS